MFTTEERNRLRTGLLKMAGADTRIGGAAITGSATTQSEDSWSDIDLAFGITNADEMKHVISDWTGHMYNEHSALHHVDIDSGLWTYRVFLLASTLQVDLAFAPASDFRPLGPTFRLISGKALEPRMSPPSAEQLIGLSWLYALHARSSIARHKLWQAEYMISGLRDHTLALACLRHGFATAYGRGMDLLPHELTMQFEASLVRTLDVGELSGAFDAALRRLMVEIQIVNSELARRLEVPLTSLGRN